MRNKRVVCMKHKVFTSVIGAICVIGCVYGMLANVSQTLASTILIIICGAFIWVGTVVQDKIIAKQKITWNDNPELKHVMQGLCVASWLSLGILVIGVLDYIGIAEFFDVKSLGGITIISMFACFSWLTYLLVAYATRFAVLICRIYLILMMLFLGVLVIY